MAVQAASTDAAGTGCGGAVQVLGGLDGAVAGRGVGAAEVTLVDSARYQIFAAASRPMPVTVGPLQVGLL